MKKKETILSILVLTLLFTNHINSSMILNESSDNQFMQLDEDNNKGGLMKNEEEDIANKYNIIDDSNIGFNNLKMANSEVGKFNELSQDDLIDNIIKEDENKENEIKENRVNVNRGRGLIEKRGNARDDSSRNLFFKKPDLEELKKKQKEKAEKKKKEAEKKKEEAKRKKEEELRKKAKKAKKRSRTPQTNEKLTDEDYEWKIVKLPPSDFDFKVKEKKKIIPKYVAGKWKPKLELPKPNIPLDEFTPNYCVCKDYDGSCNCTKKNVSNPQFKDATLEGQRFFSKKKDYNWYTNQSNIFREYKITQKNQRRKRLKEIREDYTTKLETIQIAAWLKHLHEMHNINVQNRVKKERIHDLLLNSLDELNEKTNKLTVNGIVSAIKLGIAQLMVAYSLKYPKFLKAYKAQISKWKEFIIEKDEILFDEHEEKVAKYYQDLEKQKKMEAEIKKEEENIEKEKDKIKDEVNGNSKS